MSIQRMNWPKATREKKKTREKKWNLPKLDNRVQQGPPKRGARSGVWSRWGSIAEGERKGKRRGRKVFESD
jgi:hypothetical protein